MWPTIATTVAMVCVVWVSVNGQVPIPKRPLGFVYGHGDPADPVLLKAYIDPMCPDCKVAFPTLLQVADHYGPSRVRLTVHLFPLPYHRVAFLASKGTHIIDKATQRNKTYDWLTAMFNNQSSFSNDATSDMTENQVIQKLSTFAEALGVDATHFIKMMSDRDLELDTRLGWKYTCTRGIAWTPGYMLNDVLVNADPTWTVSDWESVIDPLLSGSHGMGMHRKENSCPPGQKECNFLPGKTQCCTAGENCIPNVGCRC
ncbi:hypothetical protein ScPMuIL_005283 [Solemya velum]